MKRVSECLHEFVSAARARELSFGTVRDVSDAHFDATFFGLPAVQSSDFLDMDALTTVEKRTVKLGLDDDSLQCLWARDLQLDEGSSVSARGVRALLEVRPSPTFHRILRCDLPFGAHKDSRHCRRGMREEDP